MELKDWINTLILIATIVAIVYGPIKAVAITRAADEEREKKRRKYDILHILMRSRAYAIHADHVAALNLVQLEFYGSQTVDQAFRRYMENLSTKVPEPSDDSARERFLDERQDRFYTLVQEMALVLGFNFDRADLKRLSYSPQGLQDAEAQAQGIRARTLELLDGRRALAIKPFQASDANSKYPPPPDIQPS
jgi:hypothetical protein